MSSSLSDISGLAACPGCDLLYHKRSLQTEKRLRCPRCGTTLRIVIPDSLDKTLAMSLAGLLLYIPAMTMPIMTFTVMGLKGSGNVIDAMHVLFQKGYLFVASMVLFVSILLPLVKLALLFWVALSLKIRCYWSNLPFLFRSYKHLDEWGMVEVYMLGILVSIIKMYSIADIEYNTGIFCFSALVLVTVASSTIADDEFFWDLIETGKQKKNNSTTFDVRESITGTARESGLMSCEDCGKLVHQVSAKPDETVRCPRCRAKLHSRKPGSISRTWALVLSAAVFFLPANILPIMRVSFLGKPDDSTIMDGIVYFFHTGDYFVGGVILTASVLVPLFKVVGIIIILLSIHFQWSSWLKHKAAMFRFIEFVGRWSFLDIFVIALLSAMVRFGSLSTIEASPAATFFTAVVISTMFAAIVFDPRIMWDTCANLHEERG